MQQPVQHSNILETYHLRAGRKKVIAAGVPIGRQIVHGKARVITDKNPARLFGPGEILITDLTEPDWEPLFKKARAIVADNGSRTAHVAIVARELSVPAVVGTRLATKAIRTGQKITVDCSQPEVGLVWDGYVPFVKKTIQLQNIPATKTKILLNLGVPSIAADCARLPSSGVGLARLEFIINEKIKVHPLAALKPGRLKSAKTRKLLTQIVRADGCKSGREFYSKNLVQGIAEIAEAFYPREVKVRLSDFKSNEYQHLLGGDEFEPSEASPMLGWRGAARYLDPTFTPAFKLECQAVKHVREKLKLDNVHLLLPFVRTLDEARSVVALLAQYGLIRGKNKLRIEMMVETPANVALADSFIKLFDGFSIGTNDLTQLALGVDRGSYLVANLYHENDAAVLAMIKQTISAAHRQGKSAGICGQAASDQADMLKFLVNERIDSISVTPDSLLTTKLRVSRIEKRMKRQR